MDASKTIPLLIIAVMLIPCASMAQVAVSNGVPVMIAVDAEMDNDFAVNVTDVDFGTIAVTARSGQTGELIMSANGALDDVTGNSDPVARIISNGAGNTPGELEISGGLANQQVTIRYSNVVDMTCVSGCSGSPPDLIVSRIVDNAADQAALWSVDDADPDGDATPGLVTTNGAGEAIVNIGVSIRTENTDTPYQSGNYVGSFNVTLEY